MTDNHASNHVASAPSLPPKKRLIFEYDPATNALSNFWDGDATGWPMEALITRLEMVKAQLVNVLIAQALQQSMMQAKRGLVDATGAPLRH